VPHIPVLLEQVIQYLKPKPGYRFIDATAGGGGHAQALAQRVAPDGKVLALDWDSRMVTFNGISKKYYSGSCKLYGIRAPCLGIWF